MPDDHMAATGLFQHRRTDIAGERPFRLAVAILPAHLHLGSFECAYRSRYQNRRRAHYNLYAILITDRGNGGQQTLVYFEVAIHFPVADNDCLISFHSRFLIHEKLFYNGHLWCKP